MTTVNETINRTRGLGSTTWILKAAINNPECIIFAANREHAAILRKSYLRLLRNSNWILRLKWKLFGREHPKFMSIHQYNDEYKVPVIFDNLSLKMKADLI